MSDAPLSGYSTTCENCHTLNAPGALICSGCGVNMQNYAEARKQVNQRTEAAAEEAQARTQTEVAARVAIEARQNRRILLRQIQLVALAVSGIVMVGILVLLAMRAYQRQREEQMAALAEVAAACFAQADYLCARDNFAALATLDVTYPGVRADLRKARYAVAQQFARASQWQPAVDELDALLRDAPDDTQAIALLRDTFDRWYQDAIARGDLLTAARIDLQRLARFSPAAPTPPSD